MNKTYAKSFDIRIDDTVVTGVSADQTEMVF